MWKVKSASAKFNLSNSGYTDEDAVLECILEVQTEKIIVWDDEDAMGLSVTLWITQDTGARNFIIPQSISQISLSQFEQTGWESESIVALGGHSGDITYELIRIVPTVSPTVFLLDLKGQCNELSRWLGQKSAGLQICCDLQVEDSIVSYLSLQDSLRVLKLFADPADFTATEEKTRFATHTVFRPRSK